MSGFNNDCDSPAGSYEEPRFMSMMTERPIAVGTMGVGGGLSNFHAFSAVGNGPLSTSFPNIQFKDTGHKSLPFVITHSNLTFDQIPSVTGVPIKRKFYPPRKHLAPSNFETNSDWTNIEDVIKRFLESKGIRYSLPITIAVFSVQGVPADLSLEFDIHCCPTETSTYIIEFRRIRGDAFILSKLFFELKALLAIKNVAASAASGGNGIEEEEEEGDLTEEFHPQGEKMVYASEYFNFDALIK